MKAVRDFLRQSATGRWGFALTLLLVAVALAAPLLAPADHTMQNLPARLAPPSAAHWMGTDQLGRDILSRIIFGARVSMLVSVSSSCAPPLKRPAGLASLTMPVARAPFGMASLPSTSTGSRTEAENC